MYMYIVPLVVLKNMIDYKNGEYRILVIIF